jgi:chemotaxis protein histidine kinase CheA
MNYTGLTDFFDRLIFQTGGNDREESKKAILNSQIEHVRFFNDRTYVYRFSVLFERCTKVQKGFLALLYMRVFVQPRIASGRQVSIMWKKIDRTIMDIIKKCIDDSDSDSEKDTAKLEDDIKNKVLQELEKKHMQEEEKKKLEHEKAEYEKKERKRVKKINKRKRLLERKALESKKELSTEEDTDNEEFNELKQLQNIQQCIEEDTEDYDTKQETPPIIDNKQDTQEDLDEKNDLSKCPCGSRSKRPDLHKKTIRHRNYIDMGIIHKNKSQRERNIKRYIKNSRVITRCICGDDVKKSSRQLHEQSVKHKYFIQHGEKMPFGNYMVRCDCGQYFLKYNMSRHKNTIGHRNYIETL